MTERERILAVEYNEKPDRIPYMLDLSHYYFHRFQRDWDLLSRPSSTGLTPQGTQAPLLQPQATRCPRGQMRRES